jgi:hypothetical protein
VHEPDVVLAAVKDRPFGRPRNGAVLDGRCARRPHHCASRDGRMAPTGPNKRMAFNRRAKCRQTRYPNPKPLGQLQLALINAERAGNTWPQTKDDPPPSAATALNQSQIWWRYGQDGWRMLRRARLICTPANVAERNAIRKLMLMG